MERGRKKLSQSKSIKFSLFPFSSGSALCAFSECRAHFTPFLLFFFCSCIMFIFVVFLNWYWCFYPSFLLSFCVSFVNNSPFQSSRLMTMCLFQKHTHVISLYRTIWNMNTCNAGTFCPIHSSPFRFILLSIFLMRLFEPFISILIKSYGICCVRPW